MRRNMIKLTENRLREMVRRAVKRTLNEATEENPIPVDTEFDNLPPERHDFLDSLYDLIYKYYDVLGTEPIADDLKAASERIRNSKDEDGWAVFPFDE